MIKQIEQVGPPSLQAGFLHTKLREFAGTCADLCPLKPLGLCGLHRCQAVPKARQSGRVTAKDGLTAALTRGPTGQRVDCWDPPSNRRCTGFCTLGLERNQKQVHNPITRIMTAALSHTVRKKGSSGSTTPPGQGRARGAGDRTFVESEIIFRTITIFNPVATHGQMGVSCPFPLRHGNSFSLSLCFGVHLNTHNQP